MSEIADFYRSPSRTTDLGRHQDAVRALPAGAEELGAVVRGLLIHDFDASVRGLPLSAERRSQMQTAGASAILDTVVSLDPAPLHRGRPPERKMVGFCYHFALLHCALLRATGTPARARCGFASYFEPGRWIDHWVVEYFDGDRWRLTDPQIGRGGLTRDDFQDGLTAWRLCRDGASDPASYGNGQLWGWDELRGTLINDVGALSKVEISGWYWCDRIRVDPVDQPHADLDAALDMLCSDAEAAQSGPVLRDCLDRYPDLRPPADAVAR